MNLRIFFAKSMFISFGLLLSCAQAGESITLRKIQETGILTVGYRDGSIPFSYLDRKGQPVGYSMDICLKIADAIKSKLQLSNIEIKFVPVTSANRIAFVANDIVDLECGTTTHTIDRGKSVAFTVTIFVAEVSLVTKSATPIDSLGDLRGKTIVLTAGTTTIPTLLELNRENALELNLVTATDHIESFGMVETGRADAFVIDDVLLRGLVANASNPSDFRIHKLALSVEPYGIVLRKDDPEFKELADETIIGLFQSGEIRQIYHKWFLSPIPPHQTSLNLPMSGVLERVIAKPTDSPIPSDYR